MFGGDHCKRRGGRDRLGGLGGLTSSRAEIGWSIFIGILSPLERIPECEDIR